jgi:hypothetical protein
MLSPVAAATSMRPDKYTSISASPNENGAIPEGPRRFNV